MNKWLLASVTHTQKKILQKKYFAKKPKRIYGLNMNSNPVSNPSKTKGSKRWSWWM